VGRPRDPNRYRPRRAKLRAASSGIAVSPIIPMAGNDRPQNSVVTAQDRFVLLLGREPPESEKIPREGCPLKKPMHAKNPRSASLDQPAFRLKCSTSTP
jgi:hypothetical protein